MSSSVLFVCLGNICRSPTAHGVFEHKLREAGLAGRVRVDSAGTGDWHVGNPPDPRTVAAAARRGYDLSPLRARQVSGRDFEQFDYILAMDNSNLQALQRMKPARYSGVLDLFLRQGGAPVLEVPDPYYGGESGFDRVLDLVEQASEQLLAHVRERLR